MLYVFTSLVPKVDTHSRSQKTHLQYSVSTPFWSFQNALQNAGSKNISLFFFFLAFDFCRFCVVIRFFHPRHNVQWPPTSKDFLYQILSITLFSYLNSWKRASIFPFQCWVLNKGTTGTIFITSLVWCGPWLGIEPGTSRTRSQHYTTRLSRRELIYDYRAIASKKLFFITN